MSRTASPRPTTRRTAGAVVIGLFLVTAALVGAHGQRPSDTEARSGGPTTAITAFHSALGRAGGALPGDVTVFDDQYPGVAKLDPALLRALRNAANEAADDGIRFSVNSGWRSPQYQEQLLREAVVQYGSEREASRWVAAPDKSVHVSGQAVDVGHSEARAWLSEHGQKYGLCQIYRNEPWHYELRPRAIERGCPPMYADPSRDPRLHQ